MTLRRVLVELSVVEQRYRAVLEVLAGSSKTAVAERFGVSRQAVHRWLGWYARSRCSAFQVSVSFVITGADSPAAEPRNWPSAGTKSPLDSPCR